MYKWQHHPEQRQRQWHMEQQQPIDGDGVVDRSRYRRAKSRYYHHQLYYGLRLASVPDIYSSCGSDGHRRRYKGVFRFEHYA